MFSKAIGPPLIRQYPPAFLNSSAPGVLDGSWGEEVNGDFSSMGIWY